MDKKNKLKQSLKLVVDNDNPQAQQVIKGHNNTQISSQNFKVTPNQKIEGNNNHQAHTPNCEPSEGVNQSIIGDGNFQVTGDLTLNQLKSIKQELVPPIDSIGASSTLVTRIETLLGDVKKAQYKRIGKSYNWGALNGQLAIAFGFSNTSWKKVFLLPQSRGNDVIAWLQRKYDNTISGRIEKASMQPGYQHTKRNCYKLEASFAQQLDWNEEELKAQRIAFTGITSRRYIKVALYNQWVDRLGSMLD